MILLRSILFDTKWADEQQSLNLSWIRITWSIKIWLNLRHLCRHLKKNEAVKLQRDVMEKTETDRKEASLANSLKLNINWVWQL